MYAYENSCGMPHTFEIKRHTHTNQNGARKRYNSSFRLVNHANFKKIYFIYRCMYLCCCFCRSLSLRSGSFLQKYTQRDRQIRSQQKRRQRNHQMKIYPQQSKAKRSEKKREKAKWRYEKYSSCYWNNIVYRQILTIIQQLMYEYIWASELALCFFFVFHFILSFDSPDFTYIYIYFVRLFCCASCFQLNSGSRKY